jgi:transposase-like protein
LYAPEFEKRWRRFEKPVGLSWRVDETYVKVAGEWTYLYRAVDQNGKSSVTKKGSIPRVQRNPAANVPRI